MPSKDRAKEPEKAQPSATSDISRNTGVNVNVASNEDEALASASLGMLTLDAGHDTSRQVEGKDPATNSQNKSVEEAAKPSAAVNAGAAPKDKARRKVNIGFLPHDFPLSSTDEEAEDPVKEREGRIHRARKKQLKLHLADSIDASWPADWCLIYAQARIIEIKWIADDMATIRSRVRRNKTSWFEEMPHSKWMGDALGRLCAIQEMYGDAKMPSGKGEKGVVQHDDRFKAKFLAGFIAKELWETLPEGLREALRQEGIDGPSEVGEFEVVRGLDGEVEVRVRRKESGEAAARSEAQRSR